MREPKPRPGNRRSRGTGRLSGKDRTPHADARGKKKVTISDLANLRPTQEELAVYTKLLTMESDRGAAIMAAAIAENALEDAIKAVLANPGRGVVNTWFNGQNAPFGTFSAKISLGRALSVYDDKIERRLVLIKNIRNAFAHASAPLDFKHPSLKLECEKLMPDQFEPIYAKLETRAIFGISCQAVAELLDKFAANHRKEDESRSAK